MLHCLFRDNVPHVPDSEQNRRKVFTVIKSVTDLLLETFPDTPFYPTIGNHDSWPANQVPPGDQDEYYSTMAGYSGWHNMLDRQSLEMFRKGAHCMLVMGNLKCFRLGGGGIINLYSYVCNYWSQFHVIFCNT